MTTDSQPEAADIEQYIARDDSDDDDDEMAELRESFDDDLADLEDTEGYTRLCPSCYLRGIPAGPEWRHMFLDCPTPDCGVHIFRADRSVEIEQ